MSLLLVIWKSIGRGHGRCWDKSKLSSETILGPLHTRIKSRDREIVRAQKKSVQRSSPTHLQNHVVWSRTLKCSVKPYMMGPQPNVVSMNFYSCGSSHMIEENKSTVVNVRSAMVSWFCVRPTSKRWFLGNNPSDHETRSIQCH